MWFNAVLSLNEMALMLLGRVTVLELRCEELEDGSKERPKGK